MNELPLQEKVENLFQWAIDRTTNQPALENFNRVLRECQRRLHQPMRVAIVGSIKAGKSTLMNALLGEALVATGAVEATFNVNWLRYGERPSLQVHFKDNRSPESKSFEELTALTLRAAENRDYLLRIKYIEVAYPNDILHTFNLIDTPGLQSFYHDDSQNTLDFLQLHGQELSDVTQAEAANADAVLYLFSHSLGIEDKSIVEQFQGPAAGQTTPINAIGVLTKVDFCWSDPNVTDPLATGNRIAQRLAAHPQVRNLFYTIYPICGLLALGAHTLRPEEMVTLTELAQLPEARFDNLIRNQKRFCERDYADVPVPPVKRQQVFDRLGQYGVSLACSLIRVGVSERSQLTEKLLEQSGLNRLRDLILSHFGHRAFLIKLGTGLRQIEAVWFRERQRSQGEAWQIVDEIAGKFEALKSKEHAFQELDVLRSFYEKRLNFTGEEEKQLLEVTGEFGTACGDRLGLGERATVDEMLTVAEERMRYWQQRADDPNDDRYTIAAAKVIERSYGRILYRVQTAKEYLSI